MAGAPLRRWWRHPRVLAHIDCLIGGRDGERYGHRDGHHGGHHGGQRPGDGFHRRLAALAPDGGFPRALSVGGGAGRRERALVASGIVGEIDLFDRRLGLLHEGRAAAVEAGLGERMRFHLADPFEEDLPPVDLVYWNEQMPETLETARLVAWSRARLAPGGTMAYYGGCGDRGMDYPGDHIRLANRVRACLPERLLAGPTAASEPLPRAFDHATIASLLRLGPIDLAHRIGLVPAVRRHFDDPEITYLGGLVYALVLADVIPALTDGEADVALLEAMLLLDEALAAQGRTRLAVVFARAR